MFITSMEELKSAAIKLQDGMQAYWPQFARYETLDLNKLKEQVSAKTWAYNNSVVAFIDEEGDYYVIPCLKNVQRVLLENSYQKAYFYVPFSNWDFPIDLEAQWKALWDTKNSEKD